MLRRLTIEPCAGWSSAPNTHKQTVEHSTLHLLYSTVQLILSKDLIIPFTLGDRSFLTTLYSTILVLIKSVPVTFNLKPFLFASPTYKMTQNMTIVHFCTFMGYTILRFGGTILE